MAGVEDRLLVVAATLVGGGSAERTWAPGAFVVNTGTGLIEHLGSAAEILASPAALAGVTRVEIAKLVVPGFVDIHNHGYTGAEDVCAYFSRPEATLRFAATYGTTSMLATLTVPKSDAVPHCCAPGVLRGDHEAPECAEGHDHGGSATEAAASSASASESSPLVDPTITSALAEWVGRVEPGHAVLEGTHLEGPIVADWGGLPESETDMSLARFRTLLDSIPSMRVMTISPSVERTKNFVRFRELLRRGIVPAMGHDRKVTLGDVEQALRVWSEVHAEALASVSAGAGGGAGAGHHRSSSMPASPSPASSSSASSSSASSVASALLSSPGTDSGASHHRVLSSPATGRTRPPLRLDTTRFPLYAGVPRIHITHLFNVMEFHHRDVGLTNVGLLARWPAVGDMPDDVPLPTVEMIGDLAHVHPVCIQLALRARDTCDVAFVTDAISEPVLGRRVKYGSRFMRLVPPTPEDLMALSSSKDRTHLSPSVSALLQPRAKVVLEGTSTIAGSCDTLLAAFQRLLSIYHVPLAEAVLLVSTNPARIAGLPYVGALEVGRRGDFIAVESRGNRRVSITGDLADSGAGAGAGAGAAASVDDAASAPSRTPAPTVSEGASEGATSGLLPSVVAELVSLEGRPVGEVNVDRISWGTRRVFVAGTLAFDAHDT